MPVDREWFRAEAARHGLAVDEDDLTFIVDEVERVRAALAAQRRPDTDSLESPYRFAAPRPAASRRVVPRPQRRRSRRG